MERVRVTARALNRRLWPAVANNRDGTYTRDTELFQIADVDGWSLVCEVALWPGQCYWVSSDYIEVISDSETTGKGKAAWGELFTHWPTDHKVITQRFGANPQNYARFGLPGHEGIDIRCPIGEPYYCLAPGEVVKVSDKRSNGTPSAYGWHVIVNHADGYSSLYAHAEAGTIPVIVGQRINGGSIVAYSGNTGNSSGAHLHLTIKKDGAKTGDYPAGYVDPLPLLQHLL